MKVIKELNMKKVRKEVKMLETLRGNPYTILLMPSYNWLRRPTFEPDAKSLCHRYTS